MVISMCLNLHCFVTTKLHGICVLLRCSYKYDALGNLYRKVCSDGGNYSYLMDPFGPYGPDVIAEVSNVMPLASFHGIPQI